MASKKREAPRTAAPAKPASSAKPSSWMGYALVAAAVIATFWAYGPAMHGPFLFDDNTLQFALPAVDAPLSVWTHGVRPLLMATYWANARLSGENTFSYHVVNVLFHLVATGLIFLVLRRLLEYAEIPQPKRDLLSGAGAAVFLLHPIQTEAVAYLAGRSDSFSVMLMMMAFALFLYRRHAAISWAEAAGLFVLFGASLLAKEHAIVLPALLLLTDYWWNPGFRFEGIRRNWKLYAPLLAGAAAGAAFFVPTILHSPSAGFRIKDLTWYQYFFTQCRALFVYPRLLVLPLDQSADWNFPISRTIFDRGAIIGLVALLAISAAAWIYRRRFRLASYGWFAYLILMAPTSSFLPIRDALAERRLYLSMLGLLLIALDLVGRLEWKRNVMAGATAAIALLLAIATHARAEVWSSELALWQDTAEKAPNDVRPHFWLAHSFFNQGRCAEAVAEYEKIARLKAPDHDLLVDWGLAYDCLNQSDNALAKLRQAAALRPTAHVYSQIGMVYGKRSEWTNALEALATAEKLDPNFATTYVYKGLVHYATNQPQAAVEDYQRALAIDPKFQQARDGLIQAQARLRAGQ